MEWREWAERVERAILSTQPPAAEAYHCPECGRELVAHADVSGWSWSCVCGWSGELAYTEWLLLGKPLSRDALPRAVGTNAAWEALVLDLPNAFSAAVWAMMDCLDWDDILEPPPVPHGSADDMLDCALALLGELKRIAA